MKSSLHNQSTQVNELLSYCLIDSQSHTTTNTTTNTTDIQTTTDIDNTLIDLNTIQLTNNKLLDHLIKQTFLCSICHNLLVNTRLLLCGHQFCRECLYYWFKISNTCPLCRKSINYHYIISAINIDNFLDELINNGCNDLLKNQRIQRKNEKLSKLLDDYKYDTMNTRDISNTVTETYVQTTAYVDSTQSNVMMNRTTYYSNMNE
ncbi:unnamed protein product [Schistosoma rodhaini]|uniref:Putative ring finger protein 151 n=1 Tax=Schistosoma mansoni TaxID=6183 RepID=G4VME8_SCHMA|nr:putative ring finger protein 151 [Schistosoma mansoni]CAH8629016.1 unnamed protein product [Schistosoma rodhaini]|eukprot:XP_018653252.1 putative ring finger protein 151 [Schistosoma mansoni]